MNKFLSDIEFKVSSDIDTIVDSIIDLFDKYDYDDLFDKNKLTFKGSLFFMYLGITLFEVVKNMRMKKLQKNILIKVMFALLVFVVLAKTYYLLI